MREKAKKESDNVYSDDDDDEDDDDDVFTDHKSNLKSLDSDKLRLRQEKASGKR